MKAFLLLAALSSRAWCGPIGAADPHAAPATGFPGAFLGSVTLSLSQDPFFGSRLLDSAQLHLRSLAAMTSPRAAASYLETAIVGAAPSAAAVRAELGARPVETPRAAALLIANALTRPDQFAEILDGLESRKAGLGAHLATMLRETKGHGDRAMLAALRAAGERDPRRPLTYDRFGRFDSFFDGAAGGAGAALDAAEPVAGRWEGYGPDGRPRRSGLLPPPRE